MFKDRVDAGQRLAQEIARARPDLMASDKAIVLGIARGGVAVAVWVSRQLAVPLDVLIVRKLGVPGHEELAFGAVDLEGQTVIDQSLVDRLDLNQSVVESIRQQEWQEAKRREAVFRRGKKILNLSGLSVIIVDDGLATGATTQAAINYVRRQGATEIILAVPVAPPETVAELQPLVGEMIVLLSPANFMAVGQFYEDFPQTSDAEVIDLLQERE